MSSDQSASSRRSFFDTVMDHDTESKPPSDPVNNTVEPKSTNRQSLAISSATQVLPPIPSSLHRQSGSPTFDAPLSYAQRPYGNHFDPVRFPISDGQRPLRTLKLLHPWNQLQGARSLVLRQHPMTLGPKHLARHQLGHMLTRFRVAKARVTIRSMRLSPTVWWGL